MKTAFLFLAITASLFTLFLARTGLQFRYSTIDIHVHDTYFVFDYFSFALLSLVMLGTAFTLGGTIGTRFRNKYFIGLFLLFCVADVFIIWQYNNVLSS